jgi:pimeloyl-ACP methyl ester carboxylesterase
MMFKKILLKKMMLRLLKWVIAPLCLVLIGVGATSYVMINTLKASNDNNNWFDPNTGIDEGYLTNIGGVDQFIQIRGQDKLNPVIVFLHGGPGQPMRIASHVYFRLWTEHFTVVEWDQRGSGASERNPDVLGDSINMPQMVNDTIEVIEHVKQKLGVEKVILVGHSWGNMLGINVVGQRQDLLYAYVDFGHAGAFKNKAELIRDAAALKNDQKTVTAMTDIINNWPEKGDLDGFAASAQAVSREGRGYSQGVYAVKDPSMGMSGMLPLLLGSPNVSFFNFMYGLKGTVDIYKPLADYLYDADLSKVLTADIKVPLFFFQGKNQLVTPTVKKWVESLGAPHKSYLEFERSAHMVFTEEPAKVLVTLVNEVRPLAIDNHMQPK